MRPGGGSLSSTRNAVRFQAWRDAAVGATAVSLLNRASPDSTPSILFHLSALSPLLVCPVTRFST